MLNALAEKRGWLHYSHRDYAVAIERLYIETVDKELVIYPILRRGYTPTSTTTFSRHKVFNSTEGLYFRLSRNSKST